MGTLLVILLWVVALWPWVLGALIALGLVAFGVWKIRGNKGKPVAPASNRGKR